MKRALHILETVMSLGLNLVIARLASREGARRMRWVIWSLIAANEIRGFAVAAEALHRGALWVLWPAG